MFDFKLFYFLYMAVFQQTFPDTMDPITFS